MMMDGDVARESNPNDDFEIIGDGGSSGGVGVAVSVEVGLVANGDDESVSKRPVDEEFSKPAMNGDASDPSSQVEEDQIEHMRIDVGDSLDDKPRSSAEDLMNEFGISLDSGVADEETNGNADASSDPGAVVEEDQVAAVTSKSEEASITLEHLSKDESTPEADGQANISVEFGLNGSDKAEPGLDEGPADAQQDIPEDIPKEAPKDSPEPEGETTQDSALDVSLDTSQDATSLDISQDIGADAAQEPAEDVDQDDSGAAEEEKEQSSDLPQDAEQADAPDGQGQDPASIEEGEGQIVQSSLDNADEPEEPLQSDESDQENDGSRPPLTRSKSQKLDSSKYSRFQSGSANSSDSEGSGGTKRHTIVGAGKLDMSRFAQFGKQSTNADRPPIKRNTGTRSKSLKYGSATVQSELCHVCQKRVYVMDKVTADNVVYHKTCFKCGECKKTLSLGKYAACKGNLFCIPHFKQNFQLKGNYDFTDQPSATRQTNGVAAKDE